MIKDAKKRLLGFTLIEAIVVIFIVSVLIALAIPRFQWEITRVRSQEGHQVLVAVYGGQINLRRESGAFSANINDLDVDVTTNGPRYHKNLGVTDGTTTVSCGGGNQNYVGTLDENDDVYSLYALADGRIVCTPCPGLCQKIGYPVF